jgi:signal transduction histidine kinase
MTASTIIAPIAPARALSVGVGQGFPLRTAVLALLVAAASYVAARLGHSIVLTSQGVSVLWPACAFLVSVLLLVPRQTWPVFIPAGLLGFIVHDVQVGFAPATIALLNLKDTIEILIVSLGLGYAFHGVPRLNSSKALAKYCFFAVFLGPFVSAFIVAPAIPGSYLVKWRMWFFSQTLAFLTLTPAILSWVHVTDEWRFRESHRSRLEAVALIGGLAVLGYLVLLAPWRAMPTVLIYAFVPFLLWAALRFGSMGVSTSMIVIAFLSIWGAIHGRGPFVPGAFNTVLSLQLFLIFAALPFMTLAVVAEERERHQKGLSNVSRRLIEAHEEERSWIARELHDDFNQRVAMLSMDLEGLEGSLSSLEVHARKVGEIKTQIREFGRDIHALSHRLHSSKLEHLGLVAACKGFCRELSERHIVEIELRSENIPQNLPSEVSLCLFRVMQEALQNGVKHSGERRFLVSLVCTAGEIELTVRDSGVGFDPEQALYGNGLGLNSMKERLTLVRGRLSIDAGVGHGTTIRARVPLSQSAVAESVV